MFKILFDKPVTKNKILSSLNLQMTRVHMYYGSVYMYRPTRVLHCYIFYHLFNIIIIYTILSFFLYKYFTFYLGEFTLFKTPHCN